MKKEDKENTQQSSIDSGVEHFTPPEHKPNSGEQSLTKMHSAKVEVEDDFSAPKELLQAQALANLLDTAIKIPFIRLKVGLDSIIGLIPGIGDTIMLLASMRIVLLGRKMGMPSGLQTLMLRTALIDYGLGFIPIVGDIVDLFYKANQKNVRTMEKWWVSENKEKIDALAKKRVDEWHAEQAQTNK